MEDKTKLKEYELKIKEYLQKDKSLTGAIVTVGVTCKITNKHYTLKIKNQVKKLDLGLLVMIVGLVNKEN